MTPVPARLAAVALAACLLTACVQLPATTRGSTATATVEARGGGDLPPAGPVVGGVDVWLGDHAILVWTPALAEAGVYEFTVENHGADEHDLTVVRWSGSLQALPLRAGRVLLQDLDVVARSLLIEPWDEAVVLADLAERGGYVLLSAEEDDPGKGVLATLAVGRPGGSPAPAPPPAASDATRAAAYLVDGGVFLSRDTVDNGPVALLVQNLGPSEHDLTVLRWRGDVDALPVGSEGEVLLDGLAVVARSPVLGGGEEAVVEFAAEAGAAYALISSLPGDYEAGMYAGLAAR